MRTKNIQNSFLRQFQIRSLKSSFAFPSQAAAVLSSDTWSWNYSSDTKLTSSRRRKMKVHFLKRGIEFLRYACRVGTSYRALELARLQLKRGRAFAALGLANTAAIILKKSVRSKCSLEIVVIVIGGSLA